MPQKKSTGGFIEILVVLAGLTGLTAFGIIKTVPRIIASQPVAIKNQISPTISPSYIPTVIPTIVPDPLHAEETIGVGLTTDLQLEVLFNGEKQIYPLLGVEKLSSESASCISADTLDTVAQKITGKTVYLVNYDTNRQDAKTARYAFLEDLTLLNKDLITQKLARAGETHHPYYEEFLKEQTTAQEDTCALSPTPTLTPTRKPTSTKIPTPTQNIESNIKGESTQNITTVTPTITLKEYISASPVAKKISRPLNADLVLQLINLHRKTRNLSAFEKEAQLCTLAESRVAEIDNEIFGNGAIHAGLRARNIPYWITENMAGYGSEQANINWWLGSTIHRNAIEGDYKYSCGACTETSCVQLFTSYVQK